MPGAGAWPLTGAFRPRGHDARGEGCGHRLRAQLLVAAAELVNYTEWCSVLSSPVALLRCAASLVAQDGMCDRRDAGDAAKFERPFIGGCRYHSRVENGRQDSDGDAAERGPLEAWAGLDPTGLALRWLRMARNLPGMVEYERQLGRAESRVLRELDDRIGLAIGRTGETQADASPAGAPVDVLRRLLRNSVELSASESREHQFAMVLNSLVPDEARILAALGDGTPHALIDVLGPALPGAATRPFLQNASSVGRSAGVSLPERVPDYVTHLRALGVASVGPEVPALADDYDILLTESYVRGARAEAARGSRLPPRIVRQSLVASSFGRELWEACRP